MGMRRRINARGDLTTRTIKLSIALTNTRCPLWDRAEALDLSRRQDPVPHMNVTEDVRTYLEQILSV